jgi:hypothetical protein
MYIGNEEITEMMRHLYVVGGSGTGKSTALIEALNPEKYKHWKGTVYPFGGPETYIDYLVSLNILKPYEAN